MRPIYIEWYDPQSEDEWTQIKDLKLEYPPLLKTYGWCVKEDDKCVLFALNYDERNEQVSQSMCIPKVMIKKKKFLKT